MPQHFSKIFQLVFSLSCAYKIWCYGRYLITIKIMILWPGEWCSLNLDHVDTLFWSVRCGELMSVEISQIIYINFITVARPRRVVTMTDQWAIQMTLSEICLSKQCNKIVPLDETQSTSEHRLMYAKHLYAARTYIK